MRATITSIHRDSAAARAIEAALRADNRDTPRPLLVRSHAQKKRVLSTVTGAQDVESLLATLDDLLLCLIAADQTLSSTRMRAQKPAAQRLRRRKAPKV